jgi:hypothetical protein
VVRAYLTRYDPAFRDRIVMLAPPNHGSELRTGDFDHRNGATAIENGNK